MTYAAGFASVIRLRQKEPNLPRPYKVIGYPYIPFVLIIISILFLVGAVYSDINSSMYALIFLVLSYPLFLMTKNITL
jgi:APA family basic amino acid/polyamine antiporter